MVIRHNHMRTIFFWISVALTCLFMLRLAMAFWESKATPVQYMCFLMGGKGQTLCYLLLPLWGILVNQQELQLIQQSVESTLPVTQSVKNWGESVFPLLLKCMAIRVKEHASFLSIRQCCPKSKIILEISLVRSVARAILSRRVVLGFNVL